MESNAICISKKWRILLFIYTAVTLLRLWISSLLGVWFPGEQGADDALMVLYSAFPNYFSHMTQDWVMLKELGMPVFLQLVNFSGLSYPAALCVLWILDGILLGKITKKLSGSDILTLITYIEALYVPAVFEVHCGTRMYRAGLLMPMYVCVFALCILLFLALSAKSSAKSLSLSVLLGLVLSFTYFIKEDGIWVLMVVCAFSICFIAAAIVRFLSSDRSKKGLLVSALCILLPFVILFAVTCCYKKVNQHFFGVYETNIRTGGESGKFVEYIYQIASKDRTASIWAPKDAIEQAFDVSPTLSAHPELKEAIYTSWWLSGDIDANPIRGDFLTWIIKDAVFECGLVNTVAEKEAFFKQVNAELNDAFLSFGLTKDPDRIQLLSSLGPLTKEEIKKAAADALHIYRYHIFLQAYQTGGHYVTGDVTSIYMPAAIIANYNVLPLNESGAVSAREFEIKLATIPVKGIFALGKILIPLLLLSSLVGIFWTMVTYFAKPKTAERFLSFVLALSGLGLLAVSYVYSFMVILFCNQFEETNVLAEKMYSVGVVSILLTVIVIGTNLLYCRIRKKESPRI